jgi:psiF repeat
VESTVKKLIALLCFCIAFAGPAFAGPQQEKMKNCNKEAKEKALKGDERRAFMKSCLSNKPAAAVDKKAAQQDRMKDCNKQASGKALKGDDRKKFMSACLKG